MNGNEKLNEKGNLGMARLWNAIRADLRFQARQGMYAVYVALTLVYLVVLAQLPPSVKYWVVPILLFSDPAILGFVFIGGMVMLEKTQGILQLLAVTPLSAGGYVGAKLVSLGLAGAAAGFAIGAFSWGRPFNVLLLALSFLPVSAFFTLCGLITTIGCSTMNRFFLQMVPGILLISVPCLLPYLLGDSPLWMLFPPVAGMRLLFGAFHGIVPLEAAACLMVLLVADGLLWWFVARIFHRRIATGVVLA